jgi:hypothetical protein
MCVRISPFRNEAVDKHAPARPDALRAGAQKVYFVIFTDPVENVSLDEIRRHLETHKAWLSDVEKSGKVFSSTPTRGDRYVWAGWR